MEQPPQSSWWSRNWIWAVPVGCLAPVLCCVVSILLIFIVPFAAMKWSDVYSDAVRKAQADERVQALLGTPIEPGFLVTGKYQISGPVGSAELAIPLAGPKGTATLNVAAMKNADRWEYALLEVVPHVAGARVDLRAKAEP
jgi:hypothetical protein